LQNGLVTLKKRGALLVEYRELEDGELIGRVVQGEKDALEALYTKYSTSVYSLAMIMLKQQALAEEATQDVFLNIWLKASSYKPDRGNLRTWIMSVAHHKLIDVIRSRRRAWSLTESADHETLDLLPSPQMSTESEAVRNLEGERVREALGSLPPAQREAIMLAYFEGYSHSEIAEKLQQPLGTVKTRVRLAMQKLRAVLEHDAIQ
jgi:RNA polymerase sigma-70 factor (ECF subfamily)